MRRAAEARRVHLALAFHDPLAQPSADERIGVAAIVLRIRAGRHERETGGKSHGQEQAFVQLLLRPSHARSEPSAERAKHKLARRAAGHSRDPTFLRHEFVQGRSVSGSAFRSPMDSFNRPDSGSQLVAQYARELEPFDDPAAAVARITEIYDRSVEAIRTRLRRGRAGRRAAPRRRLLPLRLRAGRPLRAARRRAPLLRRAAGARHLRHDADPARPLRPLLRGADRLHPEASRRAGACRREHAADPPPLRHRGERRRHFGGGPARPAGAFRAAGPQRHRRRHRQRHAASRGPNEPRPLALFTAERVDYSLARLHHYTGTSPEHFQNFVLLTNYQRYVDEFISLGRALVGKDGYDGFVAPGNIVLPSTPARLRRPRAAARRATCRRCRPTT